MKTSGFIKETTDMKWSTKRCSKSTKKHNMNLYSKSLMTLERRQCFRFIIAIILNIPGTLLLSWFRLGSYFGLSTGRTVSET